MITKLWTLEQTNLFSPLKCKFFTHYFPSVQGQMPSLSSELQVFSVSKGRKSKNKPQFPPDIPLTCRSDFILFYLSSLHLSKTIFFPVSFVQHPFGYCQSKTKSKSSLFYWQVGSPSKMVMPELFL